ncbi:hypothetical protein EWM64_g1507 [Hericium alpestre]|uniref:Uncharacterized protein n=1 Tax=Hericium alpestre TaxID=135208 RepID=A0A4Z0A8A1_9AGAM|nr:hypothetical protein EWM64_g1507 [Hericium alpestre]
MCSSPTHGSRQIIRGRPVQAVSLSLYPGDEYQSLAALTSSSTPIKRLTILILDNTTPSDLLPRIATHLPSLEALHIVALVAQYDPDTLRGSSTLLSAFPALRYLTFMASNATGSLEEEASIAACWARSCPTLRTIIMPQGKVWFPMNGRWICDTSDIGCTHGKNGKDGGSDGGAAETN